MMVKCKKDINISAVIPVYNGEHTIRCLVNRLEAVLSSMAVGSEVILVDDGSTDRSWFIIQDLAAEFDNIVGICLMKNYGQHNALLCGIEHANKDIVVTLDDDLQHPPEEIDKLIEKLLEGHDVVYGFPIEEPHGFRRALASRIFKGTLSVIMRRGITRKVSAFRAFRREVVRAFTGYRGPYVSVDVLLSWGTTRFAGVPVVHNPRTVGKSNYGFLSLSRHAFDMITGFSAFPLIAVGILGILLTLFGICLLIYVLLMYWIHGRAVPGFTFVVSSIIVFAGAQLVCLGVIGIYLGRMYYRSIGRPSSVVREVTNSDGFHYDL